MIGEVVDLTGVEPAQPSLQGRCTAIMLQAHVVGLTPPKEKHRNPQIHDAARLEGDR